jgi:hypothetical protein
VADRVDISSPQKPGWTVKFDGAISTLATLKIAAFRTAGPTSTSTTPHISSEWHTPEK